MKPRLLKRQRSQLGMLDREGRKVLIAAFAVLI